MPKKPSVVDETESQLHQALRRRDAAEKRLAFMEETQRQTIKERDAARAELKECKRQRDAWIKKWCHEVGDKEVGIWIAQHDAALEAK